MRRYWTPVVMAVSVGVSMKKPTRYRPAKKYSSTRGTHRDHTIRMPAWKPDRTRWSFPAPMFWAV